MSEEYFPSQGRNNVRGVIGNGVISAFPIEIYARVAQLVEATALEAGGCGFESLGGHQIGDMIMSSRAKRLIEAFQILMKYDGFDYSAEHDTIYSAQHQRLMFQKMINVDLKP